MASNKSKVQDTATGKLQEKIKGSTTRFQKRDMKLREQEYIDNSKGFQTIAYLQKKTYFNKVQIKALLGMYSKLAILGKMDRLKFRDLLFRMFEITDDLMLDRIFSAFDGDNMGSVSESEWIMGLSVMLQGTFDEQINYVYEVYDVNGDSSIGREEVHGCFKNCFLPVPGWSKEENLEMSGNTREITDLAMKKLDVDQDDQIKIGDFFDAVQQDPLLLQALGPCLPTPKSAKTFLYLFHEEYKKFANHLSHPDDLGWNRMQMKNYDNDILPLQGNTKLLPKQRFFTSIFDRKPRRKIKE